jgi:CubicO group peptidase (beta-lactamase class C family)
MRTQLIVAAILLSASPLLAQSDQVDSYVQAEMTRTHTPGLSVAVVQNGRVVFSKGYGKANVELGVPATADTVYELLSITKQFTATAIMLLAQDGRLELDRAVSNYLPNLPMIWANITLRQLLAHTSGILDYTSASGWVKSIRLDRSPEDLIEPVTHTPLLFQPGEQWKYSNTDYYLLGMVIERVSGISYDEFISRRIFQPLGMAASRMNDLRVIVSGRSAGYHWDKNDLRNADFISPSQKWAAGGIISSAADMSRWLAALETGSLLDQRTLEEMWRPAHLNNGKSVAYGLGNELDSDHNHRSVGHQGGGLAFNASMLYFPDDHFGVVVLCNLTQSPSLAIARHIASVYLPALSDAGNTGIPDPDTKATENLRQVLMGAAQGKVNPALIAPDTREQVVPFLERAGPRMLGPMGALESLVLLEDTTDSGKRIRRYRATFANGGKIIWTITYASDGTIISLEPRPE